MKILLSMTVNMYLVIYKLIKYIWLYAPRLLLMQTMLVFSLVPNHVFYAAEQETKSANNIASYRQACEKGSAQGCFSLGVLYAKGDGVLQDYTQAAALFRQACQEGNTEGCASLGLLYERGTGVPQDKAQAAAFYRAASKETMWGFLALP